MMRTSISHLQSDKEASSSSYWDQIGRYAPIRQDYQISLSHVHEIMPELKNQNADTLRPKYLAKNILHILADKVTSI